jgi:hypothetical protein
MPRRLAPFWPVLQRGNPLARCLKHAMIAIDRGYRFDAASDDFLTRDPVTGRNGRPANGAAFLYETTDNGRAIRNSVAGTQILKWDDVNNEFDTTRGITWMVVTKPLSVDQPGVAVLYSKRDTSGGAAAGWELQTTSAPSPDTYFSTVANGAVSSDVSSVSGLSLTRSDVVVSRADPERLEHAIWVNGVKENSVVMVIVPGNNAIDLRVFNTYEGFINMVALWDRPLSDSEIRLLYTDPYRLWRPQRWYRMTEGKAPAVARNSFFLSF